MKKLSIGVVGSLICSTFISGFFINRELPVFANNEQMKAIIVFQDETLNDLARLLKPMKMTGGFGSGATGNDISLQDAVYVGAANGRAKLITLWASKEINNLTKLLPSDVGTKPIQSVADELLRDKLSNTTFAIIPVEITWKDWTLSVSRSGAAVVRGKDAGGLQTVILTSPILISVIDTRSVNIPIGYNQEKKTSIQPWFENDKIVIEIGPETPKVASTSRPEVGELNGVAGIILGSGFLNNIYFNDLSDRRFNIGKKDSAVQFENIRIKSNIQSVLVSGDIVVPPPTSVKFQATFEGKDLRFSGIMPTQIDCGNTSSLDCLQLNLKYKSGSLGFTSMYKNTLLRPEGVLPIGNFYVGSKALNGVSKIDKIQGADGKLLIFAKIRLNGGHGQ